MPISLTFVLLSLMQSPSWIIGPASAPPCRDVSLSIEAVQPLQPDFEFRAAIRNGSSVPFVLASPIRIQWDLSFRTPRGWKLVGGGSLPMDTDTNSSEGKHVEILPGEIYTKALKRPDLWGDEAKPHPRGTYRVIFTFTHDLSTIGEASFGNRICPLRANPVVFTEM